MHYSDQITMITTLPWYDLPGSHAALDRFWKTIRSYLLDLTIETPLYLPKKLTRQLSSEQMWQHPGLILSQCCGPDLFRPTTERLDVIARPVFDILNCEPGFYYSHIISPSSVLPPSPRVVANAPSSRSGYLALRQWLQRHQLTPGQLHFSGSHQQSILWIKEGRADLAAIDAHSWRWLEDPNLTIIDQTDSAPTPPFVMHRQSPISTGIMAGALRAALAEHRDAVGISGLLPADRALYRGYALTPG